jgi:hypothetical protein
MQARLKTPPSLSNLPATSVPVQGVRLVAAWRCEGCKRLETDQEVMLAHLGDCSEHVATPVVAQQLSETVTVEVPDAISKAHVVSLATDPAAPHVQRLRDLGAPQLEQATAEQARKRAAPPASDPRSANKVKISPAAAAAAAAVAAAAAAWGSFGVAESATQSSGRGASPEPRESTWNALLRSTTTTGQPRASWLNGLLRDTAVLSALSAAQDHNGTVQQLAPPPEQQQQQQQQKEHDETKRKQKTRTVTCTGGHPLVKTVVTQASLHCDLCLGTLKPARFAYGCDACDFDYCEACYTARTELPDRSAMY